MNEKPKEGNKIGALENQDQPSVEKKKPDLSKEELQERQLDDLYAKLGSKRNTLERLDNDQEAMQKIRESLGVPVGEKGVVGDKIFSEVEAIKSEIAEQERGYLDLPENNNQEGVEQSVEEFVESEEFLELQAEMNEAADKAIEKYIQETSDKMMSKYSAEFSKAENGEKAEKLFRKKFPIYFRENLKTTKDGVTHVLFRFKTLESQDGNDIFYVENIEIENKPKDHAAAQESGNTPEAGTNPEEVAPKFDKGYDPELIGKEEKQELEELAEGLEGEKKR